MGIPCKGLKNKFKDKIIREAYIKGNPKSLSKSTTLKIFDHKINYAPGIVP